MAADKDISLVRKADVFEEHTTDMVIAKDKDPIVIMTRAADEPTRTAQVVVKELPATVAGEEMSHAVVIADGAQEPRETADDTEGLENQDKVLNKVCVTPVDYEHIAEDDKRVPGVETGAEESYQDGSGHATSVHFGSWECHDPGGGFSNTTHDGQVEDLLDAPDVLSALQADLDGAGQVVAHHIGKPTDKEGHVIQKVEMLDVIPTEKAAEDEDIIYVVRGVCKNDTHSGVLAADKLDEDPPDVGGVQGAAWCGRALYEDRPDTGGGVVAPTHIKLDEKMDGVRRATLSEDKMSDVF
jgi:hypothetical protein